MKGKFYGIGVGPGDPELITLKAIKVFKTIDIFAIPKSKDIKESVALEIVKLYFKKNAEIIFLTFPMIKSDDEKNKFRIKNSLKIIEKIEEGKNVAFITLGDPMIYSTYIYLLKNLLEYKIITETIPGITSYSAISAKLNLPLVRGNEKLGIITTFNEEDEKIIKLFDTTVLMKVLSYKNKLLDYLKSNNQDFTMVSNVGKKNEKIITNIVDFENENLDYFSTVILYKK